MKKIILTLWLVSFWAFSGNVEKFHDSRACFKCLSYQQMSQDLSKEMEHYFTNEYCLCCYYGTKLRARRSLDCILCVPFNGIASIGCCLSGFFCSSLGMFCPITETGQCCCYSGAILCGLGATYATESCTGALSCPFNVTIPEFSDYCCQPIQLKVEQSKDNLNEAIFSLWERCFG